MSSDLLALPVDAELGYAVTVPSSFCRLQCGKQDRAWYLSSREHDVIDTWQTFSE